MKSRSQKLSHPILQCTWAFFLLWFIFLIRLAFLSSLCLTSFFWLFGSSRAPFSYLATESPNIPAMGRKAESSYLKSSQVRRKRFFTMSVFAMQSSFSFHDGTAMTSLAEQSSSKTFIIANENRSTLGTSLTNTAESWHSRHNISQGICVISVQRALAFVNNAHL